MKLYCVGVLTAGLVLSSPLRAADPSPLKTQKEKVSYSIGHNIGGSFKQQGVDVDFDTLIKGLKDGQAGQPSVLSPTETEEVMAAFQKEMEGKANEKTAKSKKIGEDFLAQNKSKPGVVTLPSGLQYKVLKAGTGPKPKATDTVVTNYRGTLIDGTEFDSSYKTKEPAKFPVNGVIPGWTEALQLMGAGSKWQLFIPPNLAYGERGAGGAIGPNETLIFDIELLSIAKNDDPKTK